MPSANHHSDPFNKLYASHVKRAGWAIGAGFGLLLVGISVIAVAGFVLLKTPNNTDNQVLGEATAPVATPVPWANFNNLFSVPAPELQQQLAVEVAKYPQYSFGIVVRSMDDDEQIDVNPKATFIGASTTKLLTAVVALSQVDAGTIKLSSPLAGLTVQQQLQKMVNQSNNDSWNALNNLVGYPALTQFATAHGITDFNIDSNMISANSLATLLQQIYRGELLSQASTQLLLGYMQNTNEEELLPTIFAGSGDQLYHKYGWLNGDVHDAGIIVHNGTAFIVVIMSNGNDAALADRAPVFRDILSPISESLR